MIVKNYSEEPHRYQEPGAGGALYRWGPGESFDVPDGVARLMHTNHPAKFYESGMAPEPEETPELETVVETVTAPYTTSAIAPAVTTVMESTDRSALCTETTKAETPCKRRAGPDGRCSSHPK